jgi:hypothetical protein
MNIGNIFIILYTIWHFNNYGPPEYLFVLLQKLYFFLKEHKEFWKLDFFKIKDNLEQKPDNAIKKQSVKYEEKYIEDIRKMNKEYNFTEKEEQMKLDMFNNTFKKIFEEKKEKFVNLQEQIVDISKKIKEYNESEDIFCIINDNDDDKDFSLCLNKQEILNKLEKELEQKENECVEYKLLLETDDINYAEIKKEAEITAYDYAVKEHLNKLNNCYIMENTPQGNVIMTYDLSRNSFKYYSDNTIPYRYLETVGRKYVKQFNCRPIFADMEEELRIAEEKWDKEREEEREKAENEKRLKEEALKQNKPVEEKKNVFAKFKSYNKEAGTGKVSTGAPPKNSIPNKVLTEKQENEKILLKERANRYTYEGKMANFSFIKKVDRKVVDKKYAMSFAEFKKMQKEKK